jgi:hypothetical protein
VGTGAVTDSHQVLAVCRGLESRRAHLAALKPQGIEGVTRRVFYASFWGENKVLLAVTCSECKVRTMTGPTDDYAVAVARRFREELAGRGYRSEKQAAEKHLGKPQQWLNARLRAETAWGASELHWACQLLGLDHMYVATGQREADIVAKFLTGGQVSTGELVAGIRAQFKELRSRVPEVDAAVDDAEDWPQGFVEGGGEKSPPVRRGKHS